MFDPREFLRFYNAVIQRFPSFQGHDIAALCVMVQQPERRFEVQQVADAMGTVYHVAYSAMKRLRLCGLQMGGKLTERGRVAMGVDPDWAEPDPFMSRPAQNAAAPAEAAEPDQLY